MNRKWEECHAYLMLYLQGDDHPKFRSTFFQCHLIHRLAFFNELKLDDRKLFYTMIEPEEFSYLFIKVNSEKQKKIMTELDERYVGQMLNHLQLHDLVRFLRKLDQQDSDYYIAFMRKSKVRKIKSMLSYDARTAGSIMTMDFITASPNETVEQVLNHIKKAGKRIETIYYIYVVSEWNRLIGVISLRSLLIASSEQTLKLLMKEQVISVRAHTHNKMIEKIVYEYSLPYIPVVSKNKELLGVVIVNDMTRLKEIQQSYNEEKRRKLMEHSFLKKLCPFTMLICLNIIFLVIVAYANFTMKNTTLLLLFSLLCAGIAGAYGTQAVHVVFDFYRDKANDKKTFNHIVGKKEALKGLVMTISCSIFSGIIVYSLTNGTRLSIAISVALFLSIFSSTVSGVFLAYFMGKKNECTKNRVVSMNTVLTSIVCFTATMKLFQYI